MKTFKEIAIEEGLKIVNKKADKIKQDFSDIDISYFDNCEIIRTKHTKEIRDGELVPRDNGLRDAIILKTVKKAWKKGLQPNKKTMITYKDKKSKKYDLLIIEWLFSQNKIVLVTSIQDKKDMPKYYFGPKHKDDLKIMTEDIQKVINLED